MDLESEALKKQVELEKKTDVEVTNRFGRTVSVTLHHAKTMQKQGDIKGEIRFLARPGQKPSKEPAQTL